jgi:hypothetical protein
MRSSDLRAWTGVLVMGAASLQASTARAEPPAQGFAVERFYPSAPGGGWLVMDDLDLHGPLEGAMGLVTSYAHRPLQVDDGPHRLAVVSDEAIADFSFAVMYDRWRLYVGFDMPLAIKGASCPDTGCPASGYAFSPPSVDPGPDTDTLTDFRVGIDGRILGEQGAPLRLGAGAQLWIPEGRRSDYDTDGTPRAMLRLLAAGDVGFFTYAAQAGVHVRPLDDTPIPGSPRGSELLFGVAAGARFSLDPATETTLVLGPEIYGETAFASPFDDATTGLEGILSARFERALSDKSLLRLRLGTGPGIDAHFGAPAWRALFGVELSADVHR